MQEWLRSSQASRYMGRGAQPSRGPEASPGGRGGGGGVPWTDDLVQTCSFDPEAKKKTEILESPLCSYTGILNCKSQAADF
jgi:hypothetical protein